MKWKSGVVATATLLVLAGIASSVSKPVRGDSSTVTDLPFYGSGRYLTCGWHIKCGDLATPGNGYNPAKGGIDIGGFPSGSTVYAAGHGEVTHGGSDGAWGNSVKIDHDGDEARYSHLTYYFFTGGEEVCRHVAVGYSGATDGGPHLHFGGDVIHVAPLFGSRPSSDYDDAYFEYDPFGTALPTPSATPELVHTGVDTDAYTVDDTQWPLEFGRHCPGSGATPCGWVLAEENGFGYGDRDSATFYYTTKGATVPYDHARWDPDGLVSGKTWKIYMFIAEFDPPSGGGGGGGVITDEAVYKVEWVEDSSTETEWFTIDQSAYDNEWVMLDNGTVSEFSPDNGAAFAVDLIARCPSCSDDGEYVTADAALFIPTDCGS